MQAGVSDRFARSRLRAAIAFSAILPVVLAVAGLRAPLLADGDVSPDGSPTAEFRVAVNDLDSVSALPVDWWAIAADWSPFREAPGGAVGPVFEPEPDAFLITSTGDWPADSRFAGLDYRRARIQWGLVLQLPEARPGQRPGLLIPITVPGVEVYWNGRFLHATRPDLATNTPPRAHGGPAIVPIPEEWLRPGDNTLVMRMGSLDATGAIGGPVRFGPIPDLQQSWTRWVFWYGALCSISLFLAVYNFVFYFQERSERYYLWFAFVNLSIGVWVAGWQGLLHSLTDSYDLYLFSVYFCGIITIYLLLKFIHSFLNVRENWLDRLVQYCYLGLSFAYAIDHICFGGVEHFVLYLLQPYFQSMGAVILYMIWINIRGIRAKQPFARFFFVGLMVLMVFAYYSSFVFMGAIDGEPLVNEGFFGMVLIFATVLARRYSAVHKDLSRAHGDLLVLDRMKDDFLATTSHELRTPLHGIMGLVSGVRDGDLGPINPDQQRNLVLVHDSAKRLSLLVDDILNFSKIRAGKMDLFFEDLALQDTIATVVSVSRGLLGEKDLQLETSVPADLPTIQADAVRIQQVLFNLVGNAIKYSERGTIRVEAFLREGSTGDSVSVRVSDEGVGISAEQLERIWRPFEQLEEDVNTRRFSGTGLGLAIARELVEKHGGTITAESEPGRGSVFTLTLPRVNELAETGGLRRIKDAEPVASEPVFASEPGGERGPANREAADAGRDEIRPGSREKREKTFRILAIDDDPTNLEILRQMLGSAGYETSLARSGNGGLELLESGDFDLVLLDLMMPGMSGYEVCERIRKERPGFLPILMLTARNELEDRLRGFSLGANDYLSKPFDKNELLSRIENQLAIKYLLDTEQNLVEQLQGEKSAIQLNLLQRGRQLKAASERIRAWESMIIEDMELAEKFQKRMLGFADLPPEIEVYDRYNPLLKIGGDIYNVFRLAPDRVRIFLADAAGHGINASLNTVKILSEYDVVKRFLDTLVDILEHLANAFRPEEQDFMILFSAVIVDIDLRAGQLHFASAGHLEQFLTTPDGRVTALRPPGPLIGLPIPGSHFVEERYDFPPGSELVLFTDGLPGNLATHQDAAVVGEILAADLAAASLSRSDLSERCDHLIAGLERRGGRAEEPEDDVTVLMVRRL